MSFIEHIPGTKPLEHRKVRPDAKGLGVLGLHEGRTLLLSMTRCDAVRAVAGCDLLDEKLEATRSEAPDLFLTKDYAEMLARPDVNIVAIYTPDPHHADHIIAAFEAGKDVIITKPIVNSLEHAARVLEAGKRTGRRLMVGQSTRFFEPFRRQRNALEQGEFGGLEAIELLDAHYIHRMDWYYKKSPWAAKESDWIFLGMSHPLDLVRWYLGPIEEVHCYGTRSNMGASYDLQGRDTYVVNVRAKSGKLARVMGHYGCHELPRARNCIECLIFTSQGTSLAQYHDMKYTYTGKPDDEMTEFIEDHLYAGRHYYFNSEVHGMHYGEFANYAQYFAESLINSTPNSPDLEEGIETYCLMEAVRRSADSGQPQPIDPLLKEVGLK